MACRATKSANSSSAIIRASDLPKMLLKLARKATKSGTLN
ncbi:hypothetical protein HMPREF3204_01322 [Gardnerella pickettii]|nr:hypothetical protein HMPREF3204_01322 [Gardnerella pickettii]